MTPGQKRTQQLLKRDPDYFKKLGAKGRQSVKKPYFHFKELKESDPSKLEAISYRGGRRPSS